ncbi:type II toxin-antitoxin system PemK/MazF family toxin [Maribellus mangrovi]|uniref:type II toxin-antitoxin system PemK/MazF family toxin n=1 Tax=Maribellus mangrovi TaxID=3133146 RepID=UPI0030EDCF02
MKQNEIWLADLNPVKGSEQKGMRPVVIVSGNVLNEYMPIVIVCLFTSKIKGYKGNLILEPDSINQLSKPSELLTFHIRSVSKERLVKKIGGITEKQLAEIKLGLNDILRY